VPTCYGLVADLLATRPTSPQQVVVMEFGKRRDSTDTTDFCPRQLLRTCYRLIWICYKLGVYVAYLLQTCYGETGGMDFGLYHICCFIGAQTLLTYSHRPRKRWIDNIKEAVPRGGSTQHTADDCGEFLPFQGQTLRESFNHRRAFGIDVMRYKVHTRKPIANAKVSARQPWYIGRNSLNRPSVRNSKHYQRHL